MLKINISSSQISIFIQFHGQFKHLDCQSILGKNNYNKFSLGKSTITV